MLLIDGFNKSCNNLSTSYLKVRYESMSVISFWNKAKGKVPNLSYMFHKPEPMEEEFKNVACSISGNLLFIDIQRRKKGVNNINYHLQLVVTAACTKRMTEAII